MIFVRSLRSQILAPVIGMILVVAGVVTFVSWWVASQRASHDIEARLHRVCQMCDEANFPLTENVIKQIALFSGVQIALIQHDGSIAIGSDESLRGASVDPLLQLPRERLNRFEISGKPFDGFVMPSRSSGHVADYQAIAAIIPARERDEIEWQAQWLPIVTGFAAVCAAAFVATWIASRLAKRIERLSLQMVSIASGDYRALEVESQGDAISRLTESINRMSSELSVAHERIASTERSRLINLIASGMAHQLRNSLGGAILLVQTALRSNPELEELPMALNQLKLAQESIQRLLTARIGNDSNRFQSMTVQEIHQSLHAYLDSYAGHHQVQFRTQYEPDWATIKIGEGEAVVGALLNLVMNGIEATGRDGHVNCTLDLIEAGESTAEKKSGQAWRWTVKDDGPGPMDSVAATMLEPFVTSKPEGVGLGLPMAQRIAQQLGGGLSWSRQEGWTQFVLCIACDDRSR